MALHDISQLAGAPPLLWSNVKEAFDKINQNFTTIAASGGSGDLVNFTGLETDVSPLTAGEFKLGSPTKSWSSLHISEYLDVPGSSTNGVWIGNSQIKGFNGIVDLPENSTVNGSLIIDPARIGFRTIEVTGQSSVVANDLSTALRLQTAPGIYITTDPISDIITFQNTGVVGIQGTEGEIGVSGTNSLLTLTNLGVRSVEAGNAITGRAAGAGISVSNSKGDVTITNTGVLSVQAGIGITISTDTATGIVTVSNSAPASLASSFSSFAITGTETSQESINADIIGDTVTFDAGYGILLTTDVVTDTITFEVDQHINIIGDVYSSDGLTKIVDSNSNLFTGSLNGDSIGYHTGDVRGSVFADDSSILVDAVAGAIVGPVAVGIDRLFVYGGAPGDTILTDGAGNLTFGVAANIGNIEFTGTSINSNDSSSISFVPSVIFNSGVSIEDDLGVLGNISSQRIETPELFFENDILLTSNTRVKISSSPFKLASYTTDERDLLLAESGDMIYNSTVNKFQGYANGIWVDFN